MRKTRFYVRMNAEERHLALDALLYFRIKALAQGIDTVDIDRLIRKLQKRRWF